jgi:hypothetical protein
MATRDWSSFKHFRKRPSAIRQYKLLSINVYLRASRRTALFVFWLWFCIQSMIGVLRSEIRVVLNPSSAAKSRYLCYGF